MHLVLVRHARAFPRDPNEWPDDRLRPITSQGRKIHQEVSRALVRLGVEPDVVCTSPWTRARQTAEILVEELGLAVELVRCDALAAAPDLEALQTQVGTPRQDATVVLVGHSPWMEELASLLLGGAGSRIDVDFPKSGVMGIDTPLLTPGAGVLRFFWRPGQLRKLGK